jgi:heme-degrading monooxygenase HmoA
MAPEQAPAYAEHLKNHVVPALTRVPGYAGIIYLERLVPEGVEVLVTTFWQSLDAVRDFAGSDLEDAVVADEAAALLTQFDRRVRHYEVILKEI